MVLLFSKSDWRFAGECMSVLAMAAGTSPTITSLALLVHTFVPGGETQWKQQKRRRYMAGTIGAGRGSYCLLRRWSCGLACRSLCGRGCGHGGG